MIGDPKIYVDCDYCGSGEELDMTPLARGAWDDRDLEDTLTKLGWIIQGDYTFCSKDCYEQWQENKQPKP